MGDYNWEKIQERYDNGATYANLRDEFKISFAALTKRMHQGLFKTRTKSEALKLGYNSGKIKKPIHTEESKQKISAARIKFLEANPDKVPYLINHSSKESYPEKLFRQGLELANIQGWVDSYQQGMYEYDFAFPELKIDIEIDGGTHLSEKVQKIDKRRDEWSKARGWTVIRFTAKEVKNNLKDCIEKIKSLLTERIT